MSVQTEIKRKTLLDLQEAKQQGEKIVCITSYDATMTSLVETTGIDVILVGDSLGMVVQGHDSTLPVTVDDVLYHLRCVSRVSSYSLIIGDMPFMSYSNPGQAVTNAARLMQQGGAHMVKLEGGGIQLDIVAALSERGIPVCAHLGLQPQAVHKTGGYRVQGRGKNAAEKMIAASKLLVEAGADTLLLECVPSGLAGQITRSVDIPVIGIGAGTDTDGQILVLQDVLGLTAGRVPKFVRDFSDGYRHPAQAIKAYVDAVKSGAFPAAEHCFS